MKKLFPQILSPLFLFIALPVYAADDIIGEVKAPPGVISDIGKTTNFISAIVVFITVVAGLYALWQFISGGFGYISSGGDKAKVQQSTQQITMAILGLVVIGASFILGSLIGKLLFGPSFDLLSPTLQVIQ